MVYLIDMKKSNYIERIEVDEGNNFSVMNLPCANIEFEKFIDGKFELVHSISDIGQNFKIIFKEKLYKTKQEFYLYLIINEDDSIQSKVYYKQKQLDELRLIIGQILKQTKLWKLQQKN
jgi:hypothetical protein